MNSTLMPGSLVLITGARGFIGSHLARSLARRGCQVIGLGHGQWVEADRQKWGIADWLNGDVSSANLDVLWRAHGSPAVVFHLAGGSAVGPSLAAPLEDFSRSVVAAVNVAEWVRSRSPETRIVMASSAAAYGAGHVGAIHETAACAPFSPYGFHKRMAELSLESYARSFHIAVRVVRFFSVYGPGLRKQLLWDACTRLSAEDTRRFTFGGTGSELRDWIHVNDAVDVLALAADSEGECFELFNGATGVGTTVREIAEQLLACWGVSDAPAFTGQSRPGDPVSLVADVSRLKDLGKREFVGWKSGIDEYVAWFRSASQAV